MDNGKSMPIVQITRKFLEDLNSWPKWLLESYEKALSFYKEQGYTFESRCEVLNILYSVKIKDFLLYSPNLGISKLPYPTYLKYKKIQEQISKSTQESMEL